MKNKSASRFGKKTPQALGPRTLSSRLFLQALEPRVLLDAAMAQTAQEVAQAVPDAPPAADTQAHAELIAALGAVEQHKATATEPVEQRNEVYFIDRTVDEADVLAQSLPPGAEVHFIEPGVDGVRFMADTLNGRQDVDAVHILSHGGAGTLQLGTATLTLESMQGEYREVLTQIGSALSADADMLLYGCDFGQGDLGALAVQTLGAITGADVAASLDTTGTAALGGDWTLEHQSGSIEAVAVSAEDWNYVLTPPLLNNLLSLTYTGVKTPLRRLARWARRSPRIRSA